MKTHPARLALVVAIAIGAFTAGVLVGAATSSKPVSEAGAFADRGRRAFDAAFPIDLTADADREISQTPGSAPVAFFEYLKDPSPENLRAIEDTWGPSSLAMALEVLHLRGTQADPSRRLISAMQRQTGLAFAADRNAWYHALWDMPDQPHPDYDDFKAALYAYIDPSFTDYFDNDPATLVRLDEIRWGGVRRDGIPPLHDPAMLTAPDADEFDDNDIVFGIEINGDARAYPKRILAWHEMFTDTVGGVPVAGVYCTLCGTVIVYETNVNNTQHRLGTSGFLYRSNKLMYDHETRSLWNTLQGTPVVGPLVNADPPVHLPRRPVLTTTWGEWKRRHPTTTVLSLETGYNRNYDEGVAYADYFSNDRLMFTVPDRDGTLLNKQEILGLIFEPGDAPTIAIDTDFLLANPVYHDELSGTRFVVLTDPTGANRVYEAPGVTFTAYDGDQHATDEAGNTWLLAEDVLIGPDNRTLARLPAQRAFWFGWNNAFTDVRLVKSTE